MPSIRFFGATRSPTVTLQIVSHLRGILGIGRVEVPAATPTIPRYFVALARALGGGHKDEARLCFPAFSDFVRVFGRRAGSDVAVGPCG